MITSIIMFKSICIIACDKYVISIILQNESILSCQVLFHISSKLEHIVFLGIILIVELA